jgi:ParB/RepB/Spo0J family partition protein
MKLKDLVVSSVNVRDTPKLDDERIKDLAGSIDKHSMISRIVLRPHGDSQYEIIAGSRRYHALLSLKGEDFELPESDYVVFTDLKDDDALLISIAENQQRQSLSPMELNRAALKLNHSGHSDKEIASILGISPHRLKRIVCLSQDSNIMPPEVREELRKPDNEAKITDAHWDKIRHVENPDVIKDVVDFIKEKECPPREVPSILKSIEKAYNDANPAEKGMEDVPRSKVTSVEEDPFEFSHKGLLRLEERGDEKVLKIVGKEGEEEEIPLKYYMDYLRYPDKFKCTVTFKLKIKPVVD